MRIALFGAVVVSAVVGCSSNDGAAPAAPTPTPDSQKNKDRMPGTSCDPGTMGNALGTACVPVGTTACGAGFARAESGWGCEAIRPSVGCIGATRAVRGEKACQPLDDCDAPFPPAGADVMVSATGGALPHVATIEEALKMVPPNGTIAVDAGEYAEDVVISSDVHLVGKCASKTVIRSAGVRGVDVRGELQVSLRSLTLAGAKAALVAAYGAHVQVSRCLIEGTLIAVLSGEDSTVTIAESAIDQEAGAGAPPGGGGVVVLRGGHADLGEVEIRNVTPAITAYDDGSTLALRQSIASYIGPNAKSDLVSAWSGGKVVVDGSVLATREAPLLMVGAIDPNAAGMTNPNPKAAQISISGSEISQSGFNRQAILIKVAAGGGLNIAETTVHHQSVIGMAVGEAGSSLSMKASVVRGEPTDDVARAALDVLRGGAADLDGVAIVAAIQNAVTVGHVGSRLTLTRSLVTGTSFRGPGPNAELGGSGIAVGVGEQASLTIRESSIVANQQFALYVGNGSAADVSGTLIDDTTLPEGVTRAGAVTVEEGGRLSMDQCLVRKSADAALAFGGGGSVVGRTTLSGNTVAVNAVKSLIVERPDAPAAPVANKVILFADVFTDNATHLRDGAPSVQASTK